MVGAGNVANTHAAVVKSVLGVELAAVYDINGDVAQSLARQFGIKRVHTVIGDAVAADADCVKVLTLSNLHLGVRGPFVWAGKSP